MDDLYRRLARSGLRRTGTYAGAKSTFGRDLRAVVPELRIEKHRVDGRLVRYYTRIGLQSYARNDVYPASPASVDETAGQDADSEAGSRGSSCLSRDSATRGEAGRPAYPASAGGVNQQVNVGEAGEAGTTPLWVEHRVDENANARYLNGHAATVVSARTLLVGHAATNATASGKPLSRGTSDDRGGALRSFR